MISKMARRVSVVVAVLAWAPSAPAQTLQDARQRLLRGNYAEAAEIYTTLAKEAKHRAAASIGLSKALQSEGEYDRALAVVDAALKDLPRDADLHARRAAVLYLRGRWDEADQSAAAALKLTPGHFLAHWIAGQVLRDRGEIKQADDAFRWFVRTYTERSNMDKEITDPDELLLVGLAGCERARWHNLNQQFDFILQDVWGEALKQEKDFWPAAYESARLRQEKHDRPGAFKAMDKALAINPRAAEVFALKASAALERLEIKDAESYAQKALKINPRLTEALRLCADVHLFAGQIDEALKLLARARDVNPREETTLARVATCLYLQRKQAAFDVLVKEVEKHNRKPAVFYHELAERFADRRLFDEAEKYARRAIKLQPQLPYPHTALGLLYVRQGREEEGYKILDKAFEADPFNVRVLNTLKVLDHLKKYADVKTEHFTVRYDPGHDKVLAAYMAKYLEDIYAELAKKFDYRPKGPILIEIFNKHEMFSGRVTALPDLHTIGACTGTLVAMVSPRDKSKVIAKPFNWARVMRHELVHVFNLEQTKFQVPHWFTEGLAVMNEGSPPPPLWNQLLVEKVQAKELLNLDTIMLGFVRPRSPDEWQQAYMQSLLYVEYLIDKHGAKAVAGLLAAYGSGLDTDAAIQKVCKVSKAEFERGYRAFLDARVKKVGAAAGAAATLSFKELKEAHAKDPKNADIAARLADRYFQVGNKSEAGKLADAVLEDKKTHPLAAYVKARLLLAAGERDRAAAILQSVQDGAPPEPRVFKLLAKIRFDAKKPAEAAQALERGRKLEPHDPAWLVQLAKVYNQTGEKAKLIAVLKDLVPADADDLASRRKLAQLLAEDGNHPEAERYARLALEIDVLDREAQRILLAALKSQGKDDERRRVRGIFGQ